ncbi:MAG: GlsB/YeaQ/YmgE family stress response membrane protein [Bacillota bacterium]|nr:GlsB/YeaQ/YmgE family stress response membrane protein [Bacillota bacterium]
MSIIGWLIFGALVGWIASKIMKKDAQMGAGANIVVGIIGSMLGGWLSTKIGIGGGNVDGFNFASILVGVVGASLLLFLVDLIKGKR